MADLAGVGERLDPREPCVDGGLRCVHCRIWYREAGAQAERGLLLLRVEMGRGLVRECHVTVGVGEAVCGVGSSWLMVVIRVLSWIPLEGELK